MKMSVRELSQELQKLALERLNEDPKCIQDELQYIKEWLSQQPHIISRTDDQFLLAFLRGCKHSLERTKEKIDMYYTLKTVTPEIFEHRDPFAAEIQRILSAGVVVPLPKVPNSGRRCILVRSGLLAQHNLDQVGMFTVGTMIQEILMLEDDNFLIFGGMTIQDMAKITMSYSLTISPMILKKARMLYQNGYPQKNKKAIFFNTPSIFQKVYSFFTPFLNETMKNGIYICSSIEEIYEHISRDILPEEYGGEGGKVEDITAQWKAKVESYRDWFIEDAKYKTDEKKRPGKPKTAESLFGLEGSFKQLSVD